MLNSIYNFIICSNHPRPAFGWPIRLLINCRTLTASFAFYTTTTRSPWFQSLTFPLLETRPISMLLMPTLIFPLTVFRFSPAFRTTSWSPTRRLSPVPSSRSMMESATNPLWTRTMLPLFSSLLWAAATWRPCVTLLELRLTLSSTLTPRPPDFTKIKFIWLIENDIRFGIYTWLKT